MKIPIKFKLHGEDIQVILDSKLAYDTDNRGEAKFRLSTILLAPSTEDNPRPQSQVEQTFCHELMHYLFYHGGFSEDMEDENKVELLGRLLHQALITMEY